MHGTTDSDRITQTNYVSEIRTDRLTHWGQKARTKKEDRNALVRAYLLFRRQQMNNLHTAADFREES